MPFHVAASASLADGGQTPTTGRQHGRDGKNGKSSKRLETNWLTVSFRESPIGRCTESEAMIARPPYYGRRSQRKKRVS